MMSYKMLIPVFLSLFVWQSIAEASSISTRVRVLEGKVVKQETHLKQTEGLRQAQNIKIDQSLIKVKALEKKVDDLLKGKKQTGQKAELADKRYAFP